MKRPSAYTGVQPGSDFMSIDYRGRRVLVLGIARSGVAASRLLVDEGAVVSVADENEKVVFPTDLGVEGVALGPFRLSLLKRCDEIVLSPGIPIDHAFIEAAAAEGVPVISELELGYRHSDAMIIAVTGTNGKSTTSTMIGEILKAAGFETLVAGNVGLPFCSVARELGAGGIFVLEVSSFQCEAIMDFHPSVAGLLNLTPDHLDRYEDVNDYYRAKERIIENCDADDVFFYNADDTLCTAVAGRFPGRKVPFSSSSAVLGGVYLDGTRIVRDDNGNCEVLMDVDSLGVYGLHNVENALAAVASLHTLAVPAESCRAALASFEGLPHRMERVAEVGGVTYFNDSKATNVEATVMTLRGLDTPSILIAGGHDKGGDFSKLPPAMKHVRTVVLVGEASELIEKAIGDTVPVIRAASMEEAVKAAAGIAGAGQVVVLSPACASFDMFNDFEHRGEVFRKCVMDLEGRD